MKLVDYQCNKEINVGFLANIPEHWRQMQVRRITKEHRQGFYDKEGYCESGTNLLRITDINDDSSINLDTCPKVLIGKSDECFLLKKGDFVFARTGGAGRYGFVGELEQSTIFASYLIRFRFDEKVLTSFLRYYFLSKSFLEGISASIHGGVNKNVHAEDIKNQWIALPTSSEQIKIANFLDHETAKIEALITEQERLIELLQEKRQAVISHAVTKGLNPNATLKDSGVEWLAEVPEHWDAVRLKNVFSIKHGFAFDGAFFADAGEYILMTPGNFHEEGGFREKDPEKYYTGSDIKEEFILNPGDLIIAMTEQTPGLVGAALFTPGTGTYLHNQRLGLLTPEEKAEPSFIYWLMNSKIIKEKIGVTATGQKVRHTSSQKILSIEIRLPPKNEQIDIANFIQSEVNKIAQLSSNTSKAIAILNERRSALISAAVTGQIDVRGLVSEEEAA